MANDVVPFIERRYRVLANQENRAIAGFLMAKYHVFATVSDHSRMFGYVGMFGSRSGTGNINAGFEKRLASLKSAGVKLFYAD